jgi:uridylate kinase
MKATKVEGVYDCDPVKDTNAKMFATITFRDVLSQGLRVMDATAISLCQENDLPIAIFNLNTKGNIRRVCLGEKIGSMVTA